MPTSNLLISSMSLARSLFYAWEIRLAFKDDPERRVLDFQWVAEFLPPFGSWHPAEITQSESEARALLHDHGCLRCLLLVMCTYPFAKKSAYAPFSARRRS